MSPSSREDTGRRGQGTPRCWDIWGDGRSGSQGICAGEGLWDKLDGALIPETGAVDSRNSALTLKSLPFHWKAHLLLERTVRVESSKSSSSLGLSCSPRRPAGARQLGRVWTPDLGPRRNSRRHTLWNAVAAMNSLQIRAVPVRT